MFNFGFLGGIINALTNPIVIISLFGLVASIIVLWVINENLKRSYEVWYFSESERLIEIKNIPPHMLSPRQLKTKDNYRFMRNSVAYTLKRGAKTIVVWLAKRGTAYTFKPEQGKQEDKDGTPIFKRVGTLLEGLKNAIGEDDVETLKEENPEIYQKLQVSDVFVTVDLETGLTPDNLPQLSEQDVYTEANQDLAGLIGHRIVHALQQTDYIEKIAIAGSGGLAIILLQGLGILPSFAPALVGCLLAVI